jgi:hypothetical protein
LIDHPGEAPLAPAIVLRQTQFCACCTSRVCIESQVKLSDLDSKKIRQADLTAGFQAPQLAAGGV